MYLLTVAGRWLTGLTLLTAAWLLAFSAPKLYVDNQSAVDQALQPLRAKAEEFMDKLRATMPENVSGKKKKAE